MNVPPGNAHAHDTLARHGTALARRSPAHRRNASRGVRGLAARAATLVATLILAGPFSRPAYASDPALDLSAHAGKIVYVDFWASWCTPCRASFPWMNALQEELGDDGLVIIGVNTGDDPQEAARFLEQMPADFETVTDEDGSIAEAYGLEGMPMAYVHDRNGELIASHVGFNERSARVRAEELRALVGAAR